MKMKVKYFIFTGICLALMNIAKAETYQCPDDIVIKDGQAQIPGPAIFTLDPGNYTDGAYYGGFGAPAISIDENGTVFCGYKTYIGQQKYTLTLHTLSSGYMELDPYDWRPSGECKYVPVGDYCPFKSSGRFTQN